MTYHVLMLCKNCGKKLKLTAMANNKEDAKRILDMLSCDECYKKKTNKNEKVSPLIMRWL